MRRHPVRVRVNGWTVRRSAWSGLPYMLRTPQELVAPGCDDAGVYRYSLDGVAYDHPVGQARRATGMISSHRLTGDTRYLDQAVANAERLLTTALRRRGALYLPYRFTHRLAGVTVRPPWYSAMAQGLALSAFCRLHYLTGEPRWRVAADAVFETFVRVPRRTAPWTVRVDGCGHLWLEEYPRPAGSPPLRVLNGHLFATIGVYDHLWLTGDPRAALVFDAAATTIADHGPEYRVPGECSLYSLTRPVQRPAYHTTHKWQLRRLGGWTGDARFTELADLFEQDLPNPG